MDYRLTLNTSDLRLFFKAKVEEYFQHVCGEVPNTQAFVHKVEAYVNSQFPLVLKHLLGETVGAEASDLTAAFSTSNGLRRTDFPYARMQRGERLERLYAYFVREYGPNCDIRIESDSLFVRVYLHGKKDPAVSIPQSDLASWMSTNVYR